MPRFIVKAMPTEGSSLFPPEGTTAIELGDGEKRFVCVTIPCHYSDEDAQDILEVVSKTTKLPVVVITEGARLEVMEVKQVESAWERL